MHANAASTATASAPPSGTSASASAWEDCKQELRGLIPGPFFRRFIQPLEARLESAADGGGAHVETPIDPAGPGEHVETSTRPGGEQLVLIAPDEAHRARIEERYLDLIRERLRQTPIRGQVSLRSSLEADADGPRRHANAAPPRRVETSTRAGGEARAPEADAPAANQSAAGAGVVADGLDAEAGEIAPGFFAARGNRAALAQLLTQGAPPGAVLLGGPEGSGKSAAADLLVERARTQGKRARRLNMEEFLTEFSLALRSRKNIAWRQELRSHDLLAVDDFQFLKPGAERAQEELHLLCDEFFRRGSSLILCCDRPPVKLGLAPALLSRLQSGVALELDYPELPGRRALLRSEAARLGCELSDRAIQYLAARISRDMRRLKSAVLRLERHASFSGSAGTLIDEPEQIDRICGDLYTPRPQLSPQQVLRAVSRFLRVPTEAICGSARDKRFALARHLVAYLCTEHLGLTLKEAAGVIGRRDHGSVMHARKKIEALLARDLFFHGQVREIVAALFAEDGEA